MEKIENNNKTMEKNIPIVYISSDDEEEEDMCFNFVQNTPKVVTSLVVNNGVNPKNEDEADISKTVESAKMDPIENSDSLVLRKLLRGARYFDPPDSGSWGSCYNCGEEGHTSVNCSSAKRKRPCFICGSLEHHAKQCLKVQYCHICKKGGHRTKACPEKNKRSSKWKICLKCGDSGHYDMFSCNNDYPAEDLKGIQCYLCKSFGHLCCADFADTSSIELSCYSCGQLGHGGTDCGKLEKAVVRTKKEKAVGRRPGNGHMRKEVGPTANDCPSASSTKDCDKSEKVVVPSPVNCYMCKEVGHIAKDCPSSIKDWDKQDKAVVQFSGNCFVCKEVGHPAKNCPSSTKDCDKPEKAVGRSPGNCYVCKEVGHIAKDCPSSTKGCSKTEKVVKSPGNCYVCNEVGHIAKNCPSSTKDCSILCSEKSNVRSRGKCRGCGEKGHIARDCPGSTKDCGKSYSQKTNAKSPRKCFKYDEDGHFARDCLGSTKDCGEPHKEACFKCGKDGHFARECFLLDEDWGEPRNKRCFTCGKEGHFARECLLSNEVGKRSSELSTPTYKSSKKGLRFKKSKSSTSAAFKDRKRKEADLDEGGSPGPHSLKKRGGWVADDPIDLFRRDAQMHHWNSPVAPTYSEHINYATGAHGHDFRSIDTPYGSASYEHGPADDYYHQDRHARTNESYHRYEHGPSDEIYPYRHPPSNRVDEVSSNRLHPRYVVSPPYPAYADSPSNRPSPSEIGGRTYGPSHSYEVARPHPYPSSEPPTFFEQMYLTSRFNNSRSDGMQRRGPWNR